MQPGTEQSAPMERHLLDHCARLRMGPGRGIGSYFALGLVGLLVGQMVGVGLSACGTASVETVWIAVVSPMVGFLVGVKLSQLLRGYECVVYYEMLAACLAAAAAVLSIAGEPVLPGLELVAMGVGTFLVLGRIGCLTVGCCHGRPAPWGIRYGADHAAAGFSAHYVGVRLFPVQLVDAAVSAAAVAVSAAVYMGVHEPGEVVALYVALYGVGRFAVELARGDAARPYALGVSYAQWVALVSHWLLAAIALDGWLEHTMLYLATAALTTAGSVALIAISRRRMSPFTLRQAATVAALYDALRSAIEDADGEPRPQTVSRIGVLLSYQAHESGVRQLTLSRADIPLDLACAETLRRQVVLLLRHLGPTRLVTGATPGIYHVLLQPQA